MTTTDTTDNSTDNNNYSNNNPGSAGVFTDNYSTDDSNRMGHCHNLNNNCSNNDCNNNNNFDIVLPNSECSGSPGLDCWNDCLPLDQTGPRLRAFCSPDEAASTTQSHQPALQVGVEQCGAGGQLRDDGDWVESDTCPGMERPTPRSPAPTTGLPSALPGLEDVCGGDGHHLCSYDGYDGNFGLDTRVPFCSDPASFRSATASAASTGQGCDVPGGGGRLETQIHLPHSVTNRAGEGGCYGQAASVDEHGLPRRAALQGARGRTTVLLDDVLRTETRQGARAGSACAGFEEDYMEDVYQRLLDQTGLCHGGHRHVLPAGTGTGLPDYSRCHGGLHDGPPEQAFPEMASIQIHQQDGSEGSHRDAGPVLRRLGGAAGLDKVLTGTDQLSEKGTQHSLLHSARRLDCDASGRAYQCVSDAAVSGPFDLFGLHHPVAEVPAITVATASVVRLSDQHRVRGAITDDGGDNNAHGHRHPVLADAKTTGHQRALRPADHVAPPRREPDAETICQRLGHVPFYNANTYVHVIMPRWFRCACSRPAT